MLHLSQLRADLYRGVAAVSIGLWRSCLHMAENVSCQGPCASPNLQEAANLAAFAGDWAALRVVGIRPRALQDAPSRLWDSVEALTVLLMRQAAAAQPPRAPPVVVYSGLHERLLLEADELGVIA